MSPEWMITLDRQTTAMQWSKRSAFADPLERAEWRGLQGVNTLFKRWLESARSQPQKTPQKPVSSWIFASGAASRRSQA
ncbi:hypothetical protein [Shinella sp.]|uniref:hypothetical protein n=1 Tax=Shinella sp. TaxID=1870904 RepID=UPI0028A5AA41|nr:hypothetical protein [Shinella sp.]